ncbi:MAG: hypothetical protein ABIY70_20115 [Capsulimonas sp.]|uniref:hypothetical protein n=1 Tax=Capsulimonas sp. TaxID=2494211 RepID=UPI0032661992
MSVLQDVADPIDLELDYEAPTRTPMAAQVNVSESSSLYIPEECSCCGGRSDFKYSVTASQFHYYIVVSTTNSLSIGFPICLSCHDHSGSAGSQRRLQVLGAVAATLVTVGLFAARAHVHTVEYLGPAEIISVVFFFGIAYVWSFRPLSARHATRGRPVSIKSWVNGQISLIFSSTEYATHFAHLNNVPVREWKPRFHNLHENAYRGWAGMRSVMWVMFFVLIGISIISMF